MIKKNKYQVFNITTHEGKTHTVVADGWINYEDYYGYPNFIFITRPQVKWFKMIGTLICQ